MLNSGQGGALVCLVLCSTASNATFSNVLHLVPNTLPTVGLCCLLLNPKIQ